MKLKNAPGKKNARRIKALEQAIRFDRWEEAAMLKERIVSDEQARSKRTKKNRG